MKSKISIDVDWDNQPIIKIEYEESPDVRDKLVKRFMETFKGESCWATFFFDNSIMELNEKPNKRGRLRPLSPEELLGHSVDMKERSEEVQKRQATNETQ